MRPSLSELKVLPSFCFAFKIPDDVAASNVYSCWVIMPEATDYGRPVRKLPSLHGQKSNPNPKFLDTAKANFVCPIGPNFQISLIHAFTGCPQSVLEAFDNCFLDLDNWLTKPEWSGRVLAFTIRRSWFNSPLWSLIFDEAKCFFNNQDYSL